VAVAVGVEVAAISNRTDRLDREKKKKGWMDGWIHDGLIHDGIVDFPPRLPVVTVTSFNTAKNKQQL